jgi:ribose 5-phosphate isomerase RpiB
MPIHHSNIETFYQTAYDEEGRMERNPLEFIRCKEIISRYLRSGTMEIADIGGAAGSCARQYRATAERDQGRSRRGRL